VRKPISTLETASIHGAADFGLIEKYNARVAHSGKFKIFIVE
jgi:hypothetical protein